MEQRKASLRTRFSVAVFDCLLVFVGGGFLIASFTGERTESGFELEGGSAILLFALVIAYFVIGNRTGGTIFQRIFGTRR